MNSLVFQNTALPCLPVMVPSRRQKSMPFPGIGQERRMIAQINLEKNDVLPRRWSFTQLLTPSGTQAVAGFLQ
jgi:hypothetical protein